MIFSPGQDERLELGSEHPKAQTLNDIDVSILIIYSVLRLMKEGSRWLQNRVDSEVQETLNPQSFYYGWSGVG